MTAKNTPAAAAASYDLTIDLEDMRPSLDKLVSEIVDTALSGAMFRRALTAGMDDIASVMRAVPAAEGRLLERGIGFLAKRNPDLVVLTDNLRLPVTKAAAELVAMNDAALVKALSLDADSGGRKSYTPDLLIINRSTRIGHLVDVKRSLNSYEVSRITELKNRMLAAALVVPDLLYKEHRRLHVEEVRVVILNAENQRTDIDGGVWPLTHLDHLLEIAGAGEVMAHLRELFQRRVEANWMSALNDHRLDTANSPMISRSDPTERNGVRPRPSEDEPSASRTPVSIGFARPPRIAMA
ncbi:hypothetical protein J2858_004240 [Neorhizobium galegae]|uniref:hypothetical protein n=1 Tax=Neorhizobium galegae TaxID=399 RepID=UPI001AE84172|nr:hypothetical protein [Neorhizobium galegae]MBP2551299.1 hypothetical protein [Neorhizobium galegae]